MIKSRSYEDRLNNGKKGDDYFWITLTTLEISCIFVSVWGDSKNSLEPKIRTPNEVRLVSIPDRHYTSTFQMFFFFEVIFFIFQKKISKTSAKKNLVLEEEHL